MICLSIPSSQTYSSIKYSIEGDGKADAKFEERTEVCIIAGSPRPDLRVRESPHRGFAQQPQEVDQDAQ